LKETGRYLGDMKEVTVVVEKLDVTPLGKNKLFTDRLCRGWGIKNSWD
jgi:hypothetical protein